MTHKNGKIELLRFVFCLCILMFHLTLDIWDGVTPLTSKYFSFFEQGAMGVEFFFLTTGFLLAKTVQKQRAEQAMPLTQDGLANETLRFLWRKVRGILPYHVTFCAMMALYLFLTYDEGKLTALFNRLPNLLFLQRTGLSGNAASFLSVEWYISSMLIALVLLYPLCRHWYPMFSKVIAPFAGIMIAGYLIYQEGMLTGTTYWNGFTFTCNLRAIAEICLGVGCFRACEALRAQTFSPAQKLLISLSEGLLYALVLLFTCSHCQDSYQGRVLLMLCIAVTLSFSEQGLLGQSKLFNNGVCRFLGAISLPVYLFQNIPRVLFASVESVPLRILLTTAAALAGGMVSYLVWTTIQKKWMIQKKNRVSASLSGKE